MQQGLKASRGGYRFTEGQIYAKPDTLQSQGVFRPAGQPLGLPLVLIALSKTAASPPGEKLGAEVTVPSFFWTWTDQSRREDSRIKGLKTLSSI